MTKKKVLVWETLSTVSGGQRMTLSIIDMLSKQYDFCCLIPTEGLLSNQLESRKIPYHVLGDMSLPTGIKGKKAVFRYGRMSLRNISKSIKIIREMNPDLLYAPGPAALPWSAVCGLICKKPVIWHLHHVFLDGPTKKLLNLCCGMKSVQKIIAVSECVGEQITNTKAVDKIEVIYNPVDFNKYHGGKKERVLSEIEARFGPSSSCIVVGHVALIQREKRQSFVLDVLNQLKKSGREVIGLFPGEFRDEEYLHELIKKAKQDGIHDRVWFMGRRNDIPDILKNLDALIIPSVEGFPLAGLEAAAAGVPVVACNVAGAEELIRVSGAGSCFHENNAEDAAYAIIQITNSKEEISKAGIQFAASKSHENYLERIGTVFQYVGKEGGQ